MTNPKRYVWFFTFVDERDTSITVPPDHPDFDFLRDTSSCYVEAATLIDTRIPVVEALGINQRAVKHSVIVPSVKLRRVFTRVEHKITNGQVARIPVFTYKERESETEIYCFAYRDRVINTIDRNYHNPDIETLEA